MEGMSRFQARLRGVTALTCLAVATACASNGAKPAATPATPPLPSADTKVSWILSLEHQRAFRDRALVGEIAAADGVLRPAATRDLFDLARDPDLGVRLRAVTAIGRLRHPGGRLALEAALGDPSVDVRGAAAFGLGLIGDRQAIPALQRALGDASVAVRGRAVEGLGLIGDKSAVPAVVAASAACPTVLAALEPDADPPAGAHDASLCRLALFALVRLQDYDGISRLVADAAGQPISRWWPVAYALQRVGDPRAAPALRVLASTTGLYTPGFALRGLATLKDRQAVPLAMALAAQRTADVKTRIAAVRLVGQAGGETEARALVGLWGELATDAPLALEVVAALGAIGHPSSFDAVVDAFGDRSPAVRAAVLSVAAKINPDAFLVVLSGLGPDRDWSVRAALAAVLATLPADRVTGALVDLANDTDVRVHGAALEALAKVLPKDAALLQGRLATALESDDFVERGTAARLVGETKPVGGVDRLARAYARGQSDSAYGARGAALDALAAYGGDQAIAVLESALADREWPIRAKAATLLRGLGRSVEPVLPAPVRQPPEFFSSPALLRPPYSPRALIDTSRGRIEVQLDVVAAPVTSAIFVELARSGFFNGIKVHRLVPTFVIQAGDPRGDGEGGPGFTMRDELSPTPYVRGTVGMALDWADTAGSQWFITLSPQPHLDGRYAVFGRVVEGWTILDEIQQWDVIERVSIWDGIELR
jgi:cyclophilin family peptidyl-prolyl cis-trans isomerase/HEAT repeat protein